MEYCRNKNFNAEVITLLELTTFWKKVQFLSIDHGSNHRTNIYIWRTGDNFIQILFIQEYLTSAEHLYPLV